MGKGKGEGAEASTAGTQGGSQEQVDVRKGGQGWNCWQRAVHTALISSGRVCPAGAGSRLIPQEGSTAGVPSSWLSTTEGL